MLLSPGNHLATIVTLCPLLCNCNAVVRPVTPAPMTMILAMAALWEWGKGKDDNFIFSTTYLSLPDINQQQQPSGRNFRLQRAT